MTKEKQIEIYMKNLNLSYEEALEMWEDEENDNLPDLTPEQAQVVKELIRGDRKKETAPRKRERKVDDDKRILINTFCECLEDDVSDLVITNPEREIEFTYNGSKYRLTLSKPRK